MDKEIDGREGDDERTENERSPPPGARPSRTRDRLAKPKVKEESVKNLYGKRCIDHVDTDRVVSVVEGKQPRAKKSPNHDDTVTERRRSRSRSALRDRDQSGPKFDKKPEDSSEQVPENETGNENGIKRRRRLRNRGNRNRKRNNPRNNRRYKPYAELTWEERKQRDDQESERAAQRRANRPTPYNTTQFLMEDHKVDTPDLSTMNPPCPCDSSEEIVEDNNLDNGDLMNGEYLERDFSAVYEEVQSERLESMSKEQLVSEVLELQRRVTELEDEQKNRASSAAESEESSITSQNKRTRLESVSSLEGEVERLRSENMRLRKASNMEIISP